MAQRIINKGEGGQTVRGKLNDNFADIYHSLPIAATGIVGDGITDDSDAIQDALDTYGVVYLANGIYKIDKTIVLEAGQKLIGAGITQRYPYERFYNDGEPVRGSAIEIGATVDKVFQIESGSCEIRGFYITGNGTNLDSIISLEAFSANTIIEDIFIRDLDVSNFRCIDCPGTSNSNIIRRCYFYDGDYGIYMGTPQYFITIQDCRFYQLGQNAIWANGGTSLYVNNCDFELMANGAIELSVNATFNFRFENIHIEGADPFIRFNGNLTRKGTIELDGIYAYGDESTDFLEMNAPYHISIKNTYLYGFSGYIQTDPFPIVNYDTYKDDIIYENLIIRDYQQVEQVTYNKLPVNNLPL